MNQKTTVKVTQKILAGAGVVALTVGFLIVNPLKSADEKLMSECLQRFPFVGMPTAEAQDRCRISVDIQTGKLAKYNYSAPSTPEPVAESPAASTPEPVAEAPVEHTYTYEEVMAEACAAGRQYSNDVATGFMSHSQSFAEAREYAHHLSAQSAGVDSGVIYAKIKECLW
jgi:hypothetical protein